MLTIICIEVADAAEKYLGSDDLDKIWLARYPADVPADIDADRYSSLVEIFENAAARYADRPAFINMGR